MSSVGLFMLGSAAVGAAGGIGGAMISSKAARDNKPEFAQAPESEEAKGARKLWWDKLQNWGADPNYGAISPDWGDMWKQGQQKIRDYYWGSATQPGLIGKVKGSAARRGVSDQPALEKEITKMGVEEAGDIGDMTSQQNIAQAKFGEQARQNWLQSIMGLTNKSPAATSYTQPQQSSGVGEAVSSAGSYVAQMMREREQRKWWEDMMNNQGTTPQAQDPNYVFGQGKMIA